MRALGALTVAVVIGICFVAADTARAELATEDEARQACENWLAYTLFQDGEWAGSTNPRVVDVQELRAGDELLGRCFFIEPSGFVLVPVLKELPPIKAYSETSGLSVNETVGIPQLLRDVLSDRMRLYVDRYGSLDATQPSGEDVLFDPVNRDEWDRFSVTAHQFQDEAAGGALGPRTQVGPLLTTTWHQSGPYNDNCPMGDGGRTLVGCVATAMAQLMKYWEWPPFGESSHTYYWYGDDSCGGSSPGFNISADFYDPYDWADMPDSCDGGCSPEQEAALAELSFEAGVGVEMDYGHCGSGASWSGVVYAMPTLLRYDPGLEQRNRNQYSAESWFALIQDELNAGRPMLYGIYLHAIVCDGWRVDGGQNQYHMNYGWGGSSDAWYTIDNLYCPWEGCNPMAESLIRNIQPLYASNDTCPGAQLVTDGTYTGSTLLGTAGGTASCGDSDSSRDLWYHYIAPAGGTLQIDTCESSYDTVLSVYPYCPGTTASELACDDDGCGEQSALSLDVMPGDHCLIRVAGHAGAAGSYVLNIEGPVDTVPPSPTPMAFDVEPTALSTSAITMTATVATDADSPPVKYYFDFVNVQMPGGHDSAWRTSPTYTDTGLSTNCLYGYNVRARDAVIPVPNETAPSTDFVAATHIQTPQSAPVAVTEATTAMLATSETFTNLTWGQSGLYFDCLSPEGDGGINEWVQITSGMATDLTPDTDYTFRFKARNQDAVETDWSPERTCRTKAAVPSAPVLSNATCASMDVAIGDDINPSYTTYAIHCTSTSPTDANWEGLYVDASGNPTGSAVFQTQAEWGTTTLLTMAELTTYGFEVIARNGSGITTNPGPEASLTTESCGSGGTCDDGILNQGEDRIDCGGPCPPCSCLSDGECDNGLYCDGAETCDAWGECQPGSSVDCDDGIACTIDSCNETTDQCDNLPDDLFCDNGLFCDGAEWCDPAVGCQDGADPCGPDETCNEDQDVCELLPFCATLPDPAVCMGDVNGDGVVDPVDVGLVKFWFGDTDPASLCSYDVNCDGQIDPADVGLVKFYYGVCGPESAPPCWMDP